jgi:hypothetical protein
LPRHLARNEKEIIVNRSVVACAIALALLLPLGCVYSPTGPGILYMDVKGPMGPAKGTDTGKTGRACANTFLALFAVGDASIETAKRDGGITEVTTVDHHSTNIIGFGSFCTVVTGS